jgi:hypothetical protein
MSALHERMNDFELGVYKGELNERIGLVRVVVLFPIVEKRR